MNNLEELKKKYEEFKKKYEELGEEIKRLESRKRWRAEKEEKYYFVDEAGEVNGIYEDNDETDSFYYKTRNYFKTEEEAQKHADQIHTYYDLMDLAEELNNGKEIDWSNCIQNKYYIYFNVSVKELKTDYINYSRYIGQIYCLDEDFLEKAKERIGEARLKGLFGG